MCVLKLGPQRYGSSALTTTLTKLVTLEGHAVDRRKTSSIATQKLGGSSVAGLTTSQQREACFCNIVFLTHKIFFFFVTVQLGQQT